MAYENNCGITCDPKRVGQLDSAAGDLAMTAERIIGLVGQLRSQLEPVLSPCIPKPCVDSEVPSYAAPFAGRLQGTDGQLRAAEDAIRDLLVRLEI